VRRRRNVSETVDQLEALLKLFRGLSVGVDEKATVLARRKPLKGLRESTVGSGLGIEELDLLEVDLDRGVEFQQIQLPLDRPSEELVAGHDDAFNLG
jgi:hypothetical protein